MVFCTEFVDGWCRAPSAPYTVVVKTTTHPQTRCRKPYAATQHPMLLMMGVCTRNTLAKNTLIKLPCCIKLAFQAISWGRCTVKQPSNISWRLERSCSVRLQVQQSKKTWAAWLWRWRRTLRSLEMSHSRTLESSATLLYRKLKSCSLSTCGVTRVADLDLGSKGVSVITVYNTCMLVKSFRTRNAVTWNFVPCSCLAVVQYVNHHYFHFSKAVCFRKVI